MALNFNTLKAKYDQILGGVMAKGTQGLANVQRGIGTMASNMQTGLGNVKYNVQQNLPRLTNPQEFPKMQASIADMASGLPKLLKPAGEITKFTTNQYVAPVAQIPSNYWNAFGKNKTLGQRASGALGTLGGVASLIPGVDDLAIAGVNAWTGANQAKNRNAGIKTNLLGGLQSLTGEKPAGLGDVLSTDPLAQQVGNIAQLPLMMFAGGVKNKSNLDRAKIIGEETNIKAAVGWLNNWGNRTTVDPAMSFRRYDHIVETAKKVIPEVINSKAMKKMEQFNPDEWAKTMSSILSGTLEQAKNPQLNIGFNVRDISKRKDAQAPGGMDALTKEAQKFNTFEDFKQAIMDTASGMKKGGKKTGLAKVMEDVLNSGKKFANEDELKALYNQSHVSQAPVSDIRGKVAYHYGTTKLDNNGGTWFTTNNSGYMGSKTNSDKVRVVIPDNLKLANKKQAIDAGLYSAGDSGVTASNILAKKGYDGIKMTVDGDTHYRIFNESNLIKSPSTPPVPVSGAVSLPKRSASLQQVNQVPTSVKQVEGIQGQMPTQTVGGSVLPSSTQQTIPRTLPQQKIKIVTKQKSQQPLDDIISQAKKQIGKVEEPKGKSIKQSFDDSYTHWVDRYNPIVKASQTAKKVGTVATKNDPEYLVRRLTGAGGIADAQFRRELNPILKEMEGLNIAKSDMDVYLANKRIAGFGTVGRDIKGADPKKATQVVQALEAKYGENIKGIADKMYTYQNKGFQEMVDAGFLSPEAAQTIRSQNPDYSPLYRVMDQMDDYLGLPTRKTMQGTQPISKIKGSERQILSPVESIIENTFKQRAAIEKNRVAQSIVNLQKVAPELGFSKVSKSGTDTITVWNGGKKEFWRVGQDIAETAKGVNEESMNMVLKLLQKPASLLRQGATGRNPEFMLPNILRDQLDAAVTSKYGYIPFVDYLSGLKSMLTDDEVYKQWEMSGAKIDLGELSGRKSITKLFENTNNKKRLRDWLGAGLDIMGKYSEQPTRVGLFKKAYQKTGDPLIAMMESRDATVDFARMGSKMSAANSIIPFLNVGVQGFDKLIRAFKNNPAKVLFNAALYGVAPAVATTIYNLTQYPQEYNEIPQYEKDDNFVLVKGRNANGTVDYVTFPKGNVLPTITNPAESLINHVFKNDQRSFGEMVTNVLSSTLPVIGDGSSLKEVGIKTFGGNFPQAGKPALETLLNKSFYKYDPNKEQTKDIVPSYLQNKPAYQQAYEFTPQMYKTIGTITNVSPLQVQNLMEGYLAGYSKIPAQLIEMFNKISNGEEVSPNEKTLLRRFVKQTYPLSGAKPQAPVYQPTLKERLGTLEGKVQAAEANTATGPVLTPKQQWEVETVKDKVRQTGTSNSYGNLFFYKRSSDGDVITVDKSKQPTAPTLTGYTELDKKAISEYKSQITAKAKDIYELYQQGQLTKPEAEKQLTALKDLQTKATASTAKAKKPKKMKAIKLPTIKLKKTKMPKAKKIKIRKLKSYSLKKVKLTSR